MDASDDQLQKLDQELSDRYDQSWDLDDILRRVAVRRILRQRIAAVATGTTALHDLARAGLGLALVLQDLYNRTARPEDLDECIRILQDASNALSNTDVLHGEVACALGAALRTRHRCHGRIQDLEDAVALQRAALDLLPRESHDRLVIANELGRSLYYRYWEFEEKRDLDDAVALHRQVLADVSSEHFKHTRFQAMQYLGADLCAQYDEFGIQQSLQESLELLKEALSGRPPGHPERPFCLYALGVSWMRQFSLSNGDDAWQEGVVCLREAGETCPKGHPAYPSMLLPLVSLVAEEYKRSVKGMPTLEEPMTLCQRALASCSAGHPDRSSCLQAMARIWEARYLEAGRLQDLEMSLSLRREIVNDRRPGHHRRAAAINNLAFGLLKHSVYSGNELVIKEAIPLFHECLTLIDEGIPFYPYALSNLALALQTCYKLTNDLAELQRSIAYHEQVLRHISNSHSPDKAYVVGRVPEALLLRFKRLGGNDDVHRAVELLRESWQSSPATHPTWHSTSCKLANTLCLRFEILQDIRDIMEAREILNSVLERSPPGHRFRSYAMSGLSRLRVAPFSPFNNLQEGISCLADAASDGNCNIQLRLSHALEVLSTIEKHCTGDVLNASLRTGLLDIYAIVIRLLPQVAYYGLDAAARLQVLEKAKDLAPNAAVHALWLDRPQVAVEILEEGRAVFWSQHLRLRTSYDGLSSQLAQELGDVSYKLQREIDKESPVLAARQELSKQFESLIVHARSLPGLERFMLHETYSNLSLAAVKGPIIVFVANDYDSCAIILSAPGVNAQSIRLPEARISHLQELSGRLDRTSHSHRGAIESRAMKLKTQRADAAVDAVYAELWYKIMQPVIAALNLKVR
jgi:hypothetical protein